MAKAYWIAAYHKIIDPDKLKAYASLASKAIEDNGGRFLARGGNVTAKENGIAERTVIIEFDSYHRAISTYNSALYQQALNALDNGAIRDIRIIEGID